MNNPETSNEIMMDASALYREELFTDNAVGTLRRLAPVTANGDPDPARQAQYVGSTQVMTSRGLATITIAFKLISFSNKPKDPNCLSFVFVPLNISSRITKVFG